MLRTTRYLAAVSAALTVLATTSVAAQATDTTRQDTARRPMLRDGARMNRGVAPRPGDRAGRSPGAMRFQGPRRGAGRGLEQGAPGMRAGMRRGGARMALLRGITLSPDQEKALRSSRARHLVAAKPFMVEMTSARADVQLARINGDQKALDAATARLQAARTRLDSLRSQRSPVSELRAVLTPDQQKLLDRNVSEMRDGRAQRGGVAPRDGMGPRGFRDDARPGRRPRAPLPPRPEGEEPTAR